MYTPFMEKCIIITSYIEGTIRELVDISEKDYIICADGGYDLAVAENITPSIVIGDFDSSNITIPQGINIVTVPVKKDVTDTALCLDHAAEKGYRHVLIVGGIGGRLDHTIANIQNIFAYTKQGMSVIMADQGNIVMALINGGTTIPPREGHKLSLFSHSDLCRGVTVSGAQYPLQNHTLTAQFPLGVSNEFAGEDVTVEVENGELLIIMSRD